MRVRKAGSLKGAYYNEFDAFAAAWLRELIKDGLIAPGDVDERSIVDVCADDLRGYDQHHFFAGIGGWSYALRLAGWDDERAVWTGSCPCQPFSSAGQQRGHADSRHLWPAFHALIAECKPPTVFGEQVASKLGREWLSAVRADLEDLGYACGAADLPAVAFGSLHRRHRLWFVADARKSHVPRSEQTEPSIAGWVKASSAQQCNDSVCSQIFDSADSCPSLWPDGFPNPVGPVRCFGNAIVPQVASEFIKAAA